jgi:hypothetical protein
MVQGCLIAARSAAATQRAKASWFCAKISEAFTIAAHEAAFAAFISSPPADQRSRWPVASAVRLVPPGAVAAMIG